MEKIIIGDDMDYRAVGLGVIDVEIESLKQLKSALNESYDAAIEMILGCSGRVVVIGMGKSGIVGKKIAATLASTGTKSFFIHPSEAYHGDLGMICGDDLALLISNSGETDEVVRLLSHLKDSGNTVLAITKNSDSSLARHSDVSLILPIVKEGCPLGLAPMASTTCTMAIGDALAASLMKARDFRPENFARFHPGGSLGKQLLLRVKDVMTPEFPVIAPEDRLASVVSKISSGRLGVGVVKFDGHYGIITDGDLRRGLEDAVDYGSLLASDLCTHDPVFISPDAKLIDAKNMMNEKLISTLLVGSFEELSGVVQFSQL